MKLLRLSLILFFFLSIQVSAQFNVLNKVKKKVNRTIEKNIDKTIDKTVDGAEEKIKEGAKEENKNIEQGKSNKKEITSESDSTVNIEATKKVIQKVWRKFDFVSGYEIIFSDNLVNEQVGEFPSRWDLYSGNAEVAKFGDENVIGFMQNGTQINPFMDKEEYLPEIFTIEFDVYFYRKYNEAYKIIFNKRKIQIDIRPSKVSFNRFVGVPGEGAKNVGWHHMALSFNKRALKVYYDQTRVLNIPRLKEKLTSFSILALSHGATSGDPAIIKNIRVAKGGVKLYDRLLTDGKFVTRGILFDVNKSNIKQESMGAINTIVKMMNEHIDLNFSIEGHTDSDGKESVNQTLSEDRSQAVKVALVEFGIDESRLSTKGFGETIPVDNNSTSEGKANNRRVEFVKI